VAKHSITVNGAAILNELPLLDDYFRDQLIVGEGAFFMVARAPAVAGDFIRFPKLPHKPSRYDTDSASAPINGHCVAAGFEIGGDRRWEGQSQTGPGSGIQHFLVGGQTRCRQLF
jgi:hypothetical protein